MSIASKIPPLRHLPTAALLLSLLCACSFHEYEDNTEADPVTPTEKYINLSIVVSSGNESTTRADETNDTPKGGEDGDGREAGLTRENEVTGITLMLYEDNAGINTSEDTTIDFIEYYTVSRLQNGALETETTYPYPTDIEAVYTTGEQLLKKDIDTNGTYNVIVVANQDLTKNFIAGNTTVKTIRDYTLKSIYEGECMGIDAKKFVMSLETDYTIDFSTLTPERKDNKLVYKLDNIRIERLAARVDFWMKGAEYKTKEDNSAYETPGYEYKVVNDRGNITTDKFVLTAITPFNLYNENEYLFKRVNVGGVKYLGSEDEFNSDGYKLQKIYVIDPKTKDKRLNPTIEVKYDNTLSSLLDLDDEESDPSRTLIGAGEYYLTTQMLYENKENTDKTQFATFDGIGNVDNFILCYPKENTLTSASPLYHYATGVAIEGDYYKDGKGAPEHLIYYGYLRHQGEGYAEGSTAYSIKTAKQLRETIEQEKAGTEGVPMNFGVVRNNIYRISIDEITQKGEIKWQIKVKKWDKFTHSTIYM